MTFTAIMAPTRYGAEACSAPECIAVPFMAATRNWRDRLARVGTRIYFGAGAVREAERGDFNTQEGDAHLRSSAEVTGYHVHATDGSIGHVEDLLIESQTWGIRYLAVDTRTGGSDSKC